MVFLNNAAESPLCLPVRARLDEYPDRAAVSPDSRPPARLGALRGHGVPINALALSATGVALAAALYVLVPEKAFTLMVSLSMFGAMFTWMMIFATHVIFRRHHVRRGGLDPGFKMKPFPVTTLLGGGLMLAVLVTSAFTEVFRMTLVFGVPFLLLLALSFRYIRPRNALERRRPGANHDAGWPEDGRWRVRVMAAFGGRRGI